jgi:hypothetical protein
MQIVLIEGWSNRRWLLFWFFWSILISAVYWLLGPYSYLRIQDTTDFNLPYRIAAASDFLEYGITYWQPKFSGGLPSWLMPQFDSFLITGPPFYLLPPWAAYGFIMWLQRFIAGYFTYLLCRSLGLRPIASLFAGIAFSLNQWSSFDWTLYDGIGPPATPLYLYLFDRFIRNKSQITGLLLVGLLGLFLGLVASSALYTIFLIVGLPFWFLIVRGISFSTGWPFFLTFFLCGIIAEAPGVFALFSFVQDSSRNLNQAITVYPTLSEAWGVFWLKLDEALTGLVQIYLLMAFVGMALARRWENLTKRVLILLAVILISAEIFQMAQSLFWEVFPAAKGNLRDFDQFALFVGVLVGACGLNLILDAVEESSMIGRAWRDRMVLFISFLSIIYPLIALKDVTVNLARRSFSDNYQVNFADPNIKKLASTTKNDPPFRVATVVAGLPGIKGVAGQQFYPGYVFAYGLDSADGYYRMFDKRLYSYWQLVLEDLLLANPKLNRFINKRQYLLTPPAYRFDRKSGMIPFIKLAPIPFASFYNLNLLSLHNTRFFISHWPLEHPDLLLVNDPSQQQAVREQWQKYSEWQMISEVLKGSPPPHALYIYENRAVMPRAFLVGNITQFNGKAPLLKALGNQSSSELRSTALVQTGDLNDPKQFPSLLNEREVTLTYPRPDRVVIQSRSDAPAILVLTDNYNKYWRVWVDGVETKAFPVYHLFRGVELTKGTHDIVMEYWPPYRFGKKS